MLFFIIYFPVCNVRKFILAILCVDKGDGRHRIIQHVVQYFGDVAKWVVVWICEVWVVWKCEGWVIDLVLLL